MLNALTTRAPGSHAAKSSAAEPCSVPKPLMSGLMGLVASMTMALPMTGAKAVATSLPAVA